jgi:acetamidase/formamidase
MVCYEHIAVIIQAHFIIVPFAGTIKNNEVVKIQCVDWTGGQIGNNDSADDILNVDVWASIVRIQRSPLTWLQLTKVHYLTGPFEIETAEPGDVLVVEIQDVQPLQDQPWGFTGIFAKENGGGFLDEIYPKPLVHLISADAAPRYLQYSLHVTAPKQSGTSKESSAPRVTFPVFVSQALSTPVSSVAPRRRRYSRRGINVRRS